MTNKNTEQPTQLNQESFNAIAGAFSRLQSLGEKTIVTGAPNDNTVAEREKLIEFLATQLMNHAGEFLGAWSLCHNEYLPACNVLRKIAMRCGFFTPPQPPAAPANPVNN
jgi:hypothetical protein